MTCIVAISNRNATTLAIAADSLATVETEPDREPTIVCKIAVKGEVVCAESGLTDDPNTGFRVSECVARAASAGGPFEEVIRLLTESVVNGLRELVGGYQQHLPDFYKHLRCQTRPVTEPFLAGRKNNRPHMTILTFRLREESDEILTVQKRFEGFAAVDHGNTLGGFLKQRPRFLLDTFLAPATKARQLVEAACNGNPSLVGPPIDVIVIDHAGVHWVARKSQCHEDQP